MTNTKRYQKPDSTIHTQLPLSSAVIVVSVTFVTSIAVAPDVIAVSVVKIDTKITVRQCLIAKQKKRAPHDLSADRNSREVG